MYNLKIILRNLKLKATNQIDNILNKSTTLESKSILNPQALPNPILKNNNVKERPTSAKSNLFWRFKLIKISGHCFDDTFE